MERYWCMRWLQQQNLHTVQGNVLRDDLVRLDCAPLVTRVSSMPELERGQAVTLVILGFDELALELDCRLRAVAAARSEEHTSEPQSLMRFSNAVFLFKTKKHTTQCQSYRSR